MALVLDTAFPSVSALVLDTALDTAFPSVLAYKSETASVCASVRVQAWVLVSACEPVSVSAFCCNVRPADLWAK